jgi:Tfp pilus assembly protein PilN
MKYRINLLNKKEITFIDRLTYFGLNYLRYIIIITQLVVIGVFFYRFQVDQQIIDLREEVDQKREIVRLVLPLLQEASKIDKKTTEVEKIITNQKQLSSMTNYLLSIFPETITLTNLDIKQDSINLTGNAADPRHLQAFYTLLKKDKKFADITLQNVQKIDTGYSFILILKNFKGV